MNIVTGSEEKLDIINDIATGGWGQKAVMVPQLTDDNNVDKIKVTEHSVTQLRPFIETNLQNITNNASSASDIEQTDCTSKAFAYMAELMYKKSV